MVLELAGARHHYNVPLSRTLYLNYVPDWGEHTLSLRPGDKTVLKPGMTIHFMPGIWLDTYGVECSEPFLVTETGCKKLIEYPQKIFIK